MGIRTILNALPEQARAHADATGLPYVVLSYAQSLDAALTVTPGQPTSISGAASLTMTHRLRAAADAILVGVGTVLADDPRLTVRHVEGDNPQPIVLDSRGRMPPDARLFDHPTHQPWIVTTHPDVDGIVVPAAGEHVDLTAALMCLYERDIHLLMVEGGASVIHSFLTQQLADAVMLTLAPMWIGTDGLRTPHQLADVQRLTAVRWFPADEDVVLWGEFNP